jgi:DNA polymerase-1
MDSLELWKKYHETPKVYKEMKELRQTYKNELNNSINFKIQSLAASIVNRACIAMQRRFAEAGLRAKVCLQIHDEVILRAHKDDAERAAKLMQECMENTYKLSVPLIAEPHIGTRYGDIK